MKTTPTKYQIVILSIYSKIVCSDVELITLYIYMDKSVNQGFL